ncbi:chromosome partitioning protein, ParB family [Pseudonocardia oroxyli]|uniref:Chromosome partitioning protein, ParB family n=1 Tax=Pseudonocardia oroxyli TaxID=366584 RepID=A0A1G7XGC2_PSEOR|nr:chromosome partitioning protein, ParB family [Pseudonocardia oroxyli]
MLQPVVAYPGVEGPVVEFGHRRTLAALKCGLPNIPVMLVEVPEGADRVTDQLVENDQRAGLSTAERVAGWEQLAAFGLSASAIAKRTGAKKTDVTTGLKVAGSELASRAGQRWDFLTLEHTAAIAEFDSDPEAVKAIVAAAKTGRFEHTVQRMRDERTDAEAFARARAELVEAGVEVIDRDLVTWPAARLDDHGIDAAEHVSCPGHAAYLGHNFGVGERRPVAVFVCRDVLAHGHVDATQAPVGQGRRLSEEDKAARRVVAERNKQWRSATVVRRDWLRAFAARKRAPVGAERFVLTCLVAGDHPLRQAMEAGWPLLRELLGLTSGESDRFRHGAQVGVLLEMVAAASPKRALLLCAAAVLCAWEDRTGPHTWRNQGADTARYLGQMAEWGYELSEIESYAVTGEPSAAAPEVSSGE